MVRQPDTDPVSLTLLQHIVGDTQDKGNYNAQIRAAMETMERPLGRERCQGHGPGDHGISAKSRTGKWEREAEGEKTMCRGLLVQRVQALLGNSKHR